MALVGVTACIVTRGDQRINAVLDSIEPHVDDLIVWNNSVNRDRGVYGRYVACALSTTNLVYVQDDDCIVSDIPAIIMAEQSGYVSCNMPERFRSHYPDSALVGFGACFHRNLAQFAFNRYFRAEGIDDRNPLFRRTCDVVFTTLTPRILVDVEHVDMEYAHAENRMWKQPDHHGERQGVLALARKVRDA